MTKRIEGIDYLRSVMSIFVVVWHMGGAGKSLIFSKQGYLSHTFTISDLLNFHLLLIAVPTFIFISIFLYASKATSFSTLKKRLIRLLLLLFFWPVALNLYNNISYQGLQAFVPTSLPNFIFILLTAGDTVFYFFVSLLICIFTAHLYLRINFTSQIIAFFSSSFLLFLLPIITKLIGAYYLSAFWSPLNFIPITFAAVLTARFKEYVLLNIQKLIFISLMLSFLFSVIEWHYYVDSIHFRGQIHAIPAYTRISLLFLAFPIFVLSLNPSIKVIKPIAFMSKYSLSLYCLHSFLISPVEKLVNTFSLGVSLSYSLSILLVVLSSYFIAIVLERFYLKEDVIL